MAQPKVMLSLESCITPSDYLGHPDFREDSFALTPLYNVSSTLNYKEIHDKYLESMFATTNLEVSVNNQFNHFHSQDFLVGKYGRVALV